MKLYRFNILSVILLMAFIVLGLNACSASSVQLGQDTPRAVKHTHATNKCIDVVKHVHPMTNKDHLHHYHYCEPTGKGTNGHSHPSASITGFTRHVHPNGANKHTHDQ